MRKATLNDVIPADLPGVREIAKYSDLIKVISLENPVELENGINKVLEETKPDNLEFPEKFSLENCAENLLSIYGK